MVSLESFYLDLGWIGYTSNVFKVSGGGTVLSKEIVFKYYPISYFLKVSEGFKGYLIFFLSFSDVSKIYIVFEMCSAKRPF